MKTAIVTDTNSGIFPGPEAGGVHSSNARSNGWRKAGHLCQGRGTDSCKKRLLPEIEKSLEDFSVKGWTVDAAVADSDPDPASSGKWLAMAAETLERGEPERSSLTCSMGSHAGPNTFGMAISRRLV